MTDALPGGYLGKNCIGCGTTENVERDTPTSNPLCPKCRAEGQLAVQRMKASCFHIPYEHLDALVQLALDGKINQRLLADIETRIKKDQVCANVSFRTALSAFFQPLNTILKGQSGLGKSYIAVDVTSHYFPKDMIIPVADQSPKVISHELGEKMTGNPNDPESEEPFNEEPPVAPKRRDYDNVEDYKGDCAIYAVQKNKYQERKKNSYYVINMKGKVLVFLETVREETFKMLKSIQSHDDNRIVFKYVDDKGDNHVTVIEEQPAFIQCSAGQKWLEEQSTRNFTASPNDDKEKFKAANQYSNDKMSHPWEYDTTPVETQLFRALVENIRDVVKQHNIKVLFPFEHLCEKFEVEAPRDMRDYSHFQQLLATYPLFKLYQRPIFEVKKVNYVVATVEDVLDAIGLINEISLTTKTNTEKRILDFYANWIAPHKEGVTVEQILSAYNYKNKHPASDATIRNYLYILRKIQWVRQEKGLVATDKRKDTWFPLKEAQSSLKIAITQDLVTELQNDFKTWLETITSKGMSLSPKQIDFNTRNLIDLELEAAKLIIECVGEASNNVIVSKPIPTPKQPNKPENAAKPEIKPVYAYSNKTIIGAKPLDQDFYHINKCPLCNALKKLEYELRFSDNTTGQVCFGCGKAEETTLYEASQQ